MSVIQKGITRVDLATLVSVITPTGHIGVAATVDIGMLMVVLTSTNAEKIYITVTGWRRVSTKTVLLIVTAVMDIAEMVPTVQVSAFSLFTICSNVNHTYIYSIGQQINADILEYRVS